MSIAQLLTLGLLAFLTSVFGGMVGIGGAVVLIPAFLVVPPLLGQPPLDMHTVSGITSVQVAVSSAFGTMLHRRRGGFDGRVVAAIGVPLTVASLVSARLSSAVPARALELLFAVMTLAGATLMLLRKTAGDDEHYTIRYGTSVLIATIVGSLAGMVGLAGGFLLSPLMVVVLRIPLRIVIGSTLGIVLMGAVATAVGKALAGLVAPLPTLAAIAGAVPGMWLGVALSHRTPTTHLQKLLAAAIAAVGIGMLIRVLW